MARSEIRQDSPLAEHSRPGEIVFTRAPRAVGPHVMDSDKMVAFYNAPGNSINSSARAIPGSYSPEGDILGIAGEDTIVGMPDQHPTIGKRVSVEDVMADFFAGISWTIEQGRKKRAV